METKSIGRMRAFRKMVGMILCIVMIVGMMPFELLRAELAGTETADDTLYVGDVDGDGSVTPKDVTKMRRFLAGGWDVDVATEDGDVDGDGAITPKDVTKLRRYLAGGWGVELPEKTKVSEWPDTSTMRIVYKDGTEETYDVTKDKIYLSEDVESVFFGIYPQTREVINKEEVKADPDRFGVVEIDGERYTKKSFEGDDYYFKWEPIEWKVLKVENDGEKKMLLVADKILDNIPFNETSETTVWENSSIRNWLNGEFYYTAFNGGAWKIWKNY